LCAVVTAFARTYSIHVERENAVGLSRGIVQIVLMGYVLAFALKGPKWVAVIILVGMILAAGVTAARRARGISGALRVSLYGLATGAGLVIVLMTLCGVIEWKIMSLIPIGSMIIATSMNTSAQALERFRSEVVSHTGRIEAALSLGADPVLAVTPYVRSAVEASLIPRIDNLRSLGIVWIPGLMAGMVLAGSDPIYSAIY